MTVRAWEGALVRLRAVLGSAFAHGGLGYGADAPTENRPEVWGALPADDLQGVYPSTP